MLADLIVIILLVLALIGAYLLKKNHTPSCCRNCTSCSGNSCEKKKTEIREKTQNNNITDRKNDYDSEK